MLIATAGHVDHGKTTLIRALTGVDTDRLPDEKKRGLTIDLGFAYHSSPSGHRIGFIDVPGHEKFIRNMAAGVGGVDLALLVVAADDGVMPQTREHVAILSLLGIRQCILVITRIDLVDATAVTSATEQTRELLADSTLKIVATAPVSATDGTGIEALKAKLYRLTEEKAARQTGHFRLAVDRAFSVKGSGTVVTGTVFSGVISEKENIIVLPERRTARIRSIHVNGEEATTAKSGERAAFNLGSISATEIRRGHWICDTALSVVTNCVDVQLRLLDESPAVKHWQQLKVHAGAAVFSARVALYGARQITPGEQTYAQLVLEHPQHMLFGDHFILRDHSATRTLGGGQVLDPYASRHRAFRKSRIPVLKALSIPDHVAALATALKVAPSGIDAEEFRLGRNLSQQAFEPLLDSKDVIHYTQSGSLVLLDSSQVQSVRESILNTLSDYHQHHPHSEAQAFNKLKGSSGTNPILLSAATEILVSQGDIERLSGNRLRLKGFTPILAPEHQKLLEAVLAVLTPDLVKPPAITVLSEQLDMDREVLEREIAVLVDYGAVIQVARNRFFHPEAIGALVRVAEELSHAIPDEGFTAKQFAQKSSIGRNITIDVLEYFDRVGITQLQDNEQKTRVASALG